MEQQNNPDAPYWVRRIQQANQNGLNRTMKQTEEELKKIYAEQGKKLYDNILEVFVKILEDSDNDKIFTNDLYKMNNYVKLLEYFNECAKDLGGEQIAITESAVLRTYNYAQSVVESFAPKGKIQPNFHIAQTANPKQAIYQTWCLDGKNFSDRIWQNKKALVSDLARTMADFTSRGENPYSIATGIVKRLDADLFCAYRIARTETAHAQVKGQTDKYQEMGFSHGRWLATDACEECQALDGQQFPLDQIQWMIPAHPNCCCSFLVEA